MRLIDIKIQNTAVREGIVKNPVICWRFSERDAGKRQAACRILLKRPDGGCLYDTGTLETGKQNGHQLELSFQTHIRFFAEVEITDTEGKTESGRSEIYVSGIAPEKTPEKNWIGNGTGDPFYALRFLEAGKKLKNAYCSAAATGQYELRINGKLPDDSVLNGSWTDFHKRIHYRTFEVTALLKEGRNCLSMEAGNGWYYGKCKDGRYFYTMDKGYEAFGDKLGVNVFLTLEYEDGTREEVVTDESWRILESPVTYTNIYGSEDFDSRKENTYWLFSPEEEEKLAKAAFLEDGPKLGTLEPMLYAPVKVIRAYEGKPVAVEPDGSLVYDLGQNMAFLFELRVKGTCGQKLRLQCAENWKAGESFHPMTNSWCEETLSGETECFAPKFTYLAGRYVKVEFLQEAGEEKPEVLYLRGCQISSSVERTGEFRCSDGRYDEIRNLIENSIRNNLQHVHTDCPTAERLGWQEPNHLMAPSIMYTYDVEPFWEKIEWDQCDSQYPKGEKDVDHGAFPHTYEAGLLPSIAPRYARFLVDGGDGSFWDIIPWGSSLVMGLKERERFYGEKKDAGDFYTFIRKYTDYQYEKYLSYASVYGKKEGICFLRQGLGDWGTWRKEDNSRENIETAYLYRNLLLTAELAGRTGRKTDQKKYEILAEDCKEQYNNLLLKKHPVTGEWYYQSWESDDDGIIQGNQAVPLQFGLVPEDKKASVEKSFLESVKEHRFLAGEIALPYIFRTLGELGEMDIVHDMILQKEHPSYYRFVEKGETCLPEFWSDEARSRDHDMMGSILEWFYRYVAGISSEDGYSSIRIEPRLPKALDWAECRYQSLTGLVEVSVRRKEGGRLEVSCRIPANTVGTLEVNGKTIALTGGMTCRFC